MVAILLYPLFESTLPAITMTNTNLERAASLIQQFKQTSDNQGHGDTQLVFLKPLCEELIASIAPLYEPSDVEFMVDIIESLKLRTIPGAIEQILTNLINNSCQHGFSASQGGSGLGLSIVYNLVTQKLKGDIRIVEQHASIGAHFQIRLPLHLD
jgi:signal transduction histidine kinase